MAKRKRGADTHAKVSRVNALIAEGHTKASALKKAGLSPSTYNYQMKKQPRLKVHDLKKSFKGTKIPKSKNDTVTVIVVRGDIASVTEVLGRIDG